MALDWQAYFRGREFRVDEDLVEVSLHTGQRQRVVIAEETDCYHLTSTVARPRVGSDLESPGMLAWERNRATPLVGFRVDDRGRMLRDAWIPKAGLTADEFQLYVLTLAVEADRLEHQRTGEDVE